ncbi:MAG: pilin [Patescibacteria group bacterium]
MKKSVKQLLLLISMILLLSLPYFVFAATPKPLDKMKAVAGNSYKTDTPLLTFVGNFIAILLSLLGVIFVILMIYAGFKWMMAAGDADDVKKAKGTIRMAIIGLIVTVSAYAMWAFISTYLLS